MKNHLNHFCTVYLYSCSPISAKAYANLKTPKFIFRISTNGGIVTIYNPNDKNENLNNDDLYDMRKTE